MKIFKIFREIDRQRIRRNLKREIQSDSTGPGDKERKILSTIFSVFTALVITFSILNYLTIDEDAEAATEKGQNSIYYNEACSGCISYIDDELIPELEDLGFENISKKDYINEVNYRKEMNNLIEENAIPYYLQSHIMTFVYSNVTIILGGHVPVQVITDIIEWENLSVINKILIFQDEMDNPTTYLVWGFEGEIKEYPIDTPILEYLVWFYNNQGSLDSSEDHYENDSNLFSLVIINGLLDGINPCAIAVLLFFISFLYMMQYTRKKILASGIVYIMAIFLIYFLIGLGLLKAIIISGEPHFMAKVGAGLVIFLGIINIVGFIWPDIPLKLEIPRFSRTKIKGAMDKTTLPSTMVLGILVGLCTFPCSGGIYVATIGLLSIKSTYLTGLLYLIIYNLMFIIPLIIILGFSNNRSLTKKFSKWHRNNRRSMNLIIGTIMILLGIIILIWWV
ncbi:MAG: cytochrome c biogenesis CcdA family protein [Candidatus Hodarchaeales archaeon]